LGGAVIVHHWQERWSRKNHMSRHWNRVIILRMSELTLTAIFEEAEEGGYIAYVAELRRKYSR